MSSTLPLTVLSKIVRDYARGKEPIGYTPEMLAARDKMIAEFEEFKKTTPNAWIDVGDDDLDGLPD